MKESDAVRRRHAKERSDIQRQQCAVFDKQLQQHERERVHAERNGAKKKSVSYVHRSVTSLILVVYLTTKCRYVISIFCILACIFVVYFCVSLYVFVYFYFSYCMSTFVVNKRNSIAPVVLHFVFYFLFS